MPSLSRRGVAMPPSPIRKLVPYAEAAKRKGRKVYHVNIGQDQKVLAYGHSAGLWEYRDQLVRYYARHGVEVTSDEIVVTTGGSEAILFALLAVADTDDEVIIPEPFYTNYLGFAMVAGVKVVPVTCSIDDGFALPPISDLAAKITPKTRAIMVCNPNNPTGYVYREAELLALRDLVREHDLFLLSDEVYREFTFDGPAARSVLTLEGIDDRAILLDSVSKRYSACGARIGCVATKNREILDACLRMGQARLCPPTMEQLAAARAVDTAPEYLERVHAEYLARRDAVAEELACIDGVTAPLPGGAFYAMAKLPVDDADDFCRWLLEEFEDDGETVMLAPAAGFYATPGLGRDEVRIAFVLNVESMRRAMRILKSGLDAYRR